MKVAHLVSSGGFFGAERVMLSLGAQQNSNGHKVWIGGILNPKNPHLEVIEEAKKLGLSTFTVKSSWQLDLGAVDRLADFMRESEIELLHTHNIKANVLGLLASKKMGIPIIATNHLWTRADWKLRFYEGVDAFLYRKFFRRVVAVSEEIKLDMLLAGVPAEKIVVIPNGIEGPSQPGQKLDIPRGKIVLGVVARLSPEKGHRFLFEAIKGKDDLFLLVVGDGPAKMELQALAADLQLQNRVLFTGYRKDMENIYATIDVLVQPSLREGLPMTLLEAMIRGKAVVATRVGGVPGLIRNGENGLLVDAGASGQLAEAIEKLVKDPFFRGCLGDAARRFVQKNYSIEKMVSRYEDVYKELLRN